MSFWLVLEKYSC